VMLFSNTIFASSMESTSKSYTSPSQDSTKFKKNATLFINCSPYPKSFSYLERNRIGKIPKNAKNLHFGDYLKIYLYNLNPYQYNVEINDVQQDFKLDRPNNLEVFKQEEANKMNGVNELNQFVPESNPVDEKDLILRYAEGSNLLSFFIQKTKTNLNPDEESLKAEKDELDRILFEQGLRYNQNLEDLWKSIDSVTQVEITPKFELAKKYDELYLEFKSLSYRFLSSLLPIQIKSYDQLTITVKLSKKGDNQTVSKREYTYRIIGGIKVDQSFGIGLNGLYNDQHYLKEVMVKDTTFANLNGIVILTQDSTNFGQDSITAIEDVTKKEILENSNRDSSQFSIGLTTLTHFYYRLGLVNIGPQIGISVDIFPEQNVRYLFGGSIMLNDGRHRVSLDAGWSFGKVKKLHPAYEVGDLITQSNSNYPEITVTRKSWYFGISYNIPITSTVEQATATKK